MSNASDPRNKTDANKYAPGDPTQPRDYHFEPEDFSEQGEDDVLTTPPDEVEESFQPPSELDTDD